jgi:hypothetical protein
VASYKVNKDGSGYIVLRNFLGVGGDGESPGALLLMTNGVFYGTARFGGWGVIGQSFSLLLGATSTDSDVLPDGTIVPDVLTRHIVMIADSPEFTIRLSPGGYSREWPYSFSTLHVLR